MQPSATADEVVAGRYQLQRKLARGGMGEVFAATDMSNGQVVALKRMLPELQQRSHVVQFMREYHALSELRHPRIIEVYDYGVDRNAPYFTMELLDGQDLGELSPLPYREACRHLRDVACSLTLLHARRMVHRDLSPRNVRCTSAGRCKLLDFGAMVPFGIPPNFTGTPPCIPPEALQGGELDQRSDLFSLGALAYALLTGRHAYAVTQVGSLPDAWMAPLVRPQRLVRDLPERLDALIVALMSVDPGKRPRTASEVIELLTAIAELDPDDSPAVARSFLVSSQLVGRAHECSVLRTRLTRTLEGHGSAHVFAGPIGCGRSRMLAEAALIAQTCGLAAVRLVARDERGAASTLIRELVLAVRKVAPKAADRAAQASPLVAALVTAEPRVSAQTDDLRAQLLSQVVRYVRDVASQRALLITVDDVARADDFSRALLAALVLETASCPLSLIASHEVAADSSSFAHLITTLGLRELDRAQTLQLVSSLFDDVPHLERVSEWLFAVARGSPKLTMELAEHLLSRDIIRHVAGSWVLPAEIVEPVPASLGDTLLSRLRAASPSALLLAELLCLRRGGATAECFLELANLPDDQVFAGLEELVGLGVFAMAGSEYIIAQAELRAALARSIAPVRRHALHGRWADWLLARPNQDEDTQFEAGWQLVHTERALQGADLLARIGPALVQRRIAMSRAIPAIERALELYEQHGRPMRERLYLRSTLVMSSYLFHPRLADRYADATLDALYPFTGYAVLPRLSRWFGHTLGYLLSLGWTTLRWAFQRLPNVIEAATYYGRSTMGLMGLRALASDVQRARTTLERMRWFEHAPFPILSMIYNLAAAITCNAEGRWGEARVLIERALRRLDAGKPWLTSDQEHLDLLTGVLLLKGINACYVERSDALGVAQRLEAIGTQLSAAAAQRIRVTYHQCRAETAETQHCMHKLDLQAIQQGSSWQIDWIANPVENLAGLLWSDLTLLRRALHRLEQLAAERPEFCGNRDTARIDYHFKRGDFAKVAALGDKFIEQHPPGSFISWTIMYANTAMAHLKLGKPELARSICERAIAQLSADDQAFVVMVLPLEAAYATTLAVLGERARAEAIFEARLARQRALGDYVRIYQVWEHRVEMLRVLADRPALTQAVGELCAAAQASGNANLIALAESIANRDVLRSSPLPAASPANDQMETNALDSDETHALRERDG